MTIKVPYITIIDIIFSTSLADLRTMENPKINKKNLK